MATPVAVQQGRRKRQLARTMRRFELALARLPRPSLQRNKPIGFGWGLFRRRGGVLLGGLLLIAVASTIGYVHTDPQWFVYRDTVSISGLTYLDAEPIYAASAVDSWNIFWLRPEQIRSRIVTLPFVADATVAIAPPNTVKIHVIESKPVALWVTNDETLWVMADGRARPMLDDRHGDLPQLIDPHGDAQAVTETNQPMMDAWVLAGAQGLWAALPNLGQLRFNQDYGLNFNLPGALTWVYWGDGRNQEVKLTHLAAVQRLIANNEAQPQIVDLRFERVYIH